MMMLAREALTVQEDVIHVTAAHAHKLVREEHC